MILENFSSEKRWQDFLEEYKKTNDPGPNNIGKIKPSGKKIPASLYAEEDLWPFITSAFFKAFNIPLLLVTSTFERADQLEKEIKSMIPLTHVSGFSSLGNSLFYRNKTTDNLSLAKRLVTLKKITGFKDDLRPFIMITTSSAILNLMPESKISDKGVIKISDLSSPSL